MLNDKLAAEAKRLAAERNISLSEVVNEALRERLARPRLSGGAGSFSMPVFRGKSPEIDSTPGELASIGDSDELGQFHP